MGRRFPGLELADVGWRVEGQQVTLCICCPLPWAPDPIPDLHHPARLKDGLSALQKGFLAPILLMLGGEPSLCSCFACPRAGCRCAP